MPQVKFSVEGNRKSAVLVVEDGDHGARMLDLKNGSATIEVSGADIATCTLVAHGDAGDKLKLIIANSAGAQIDAYSIWFDTHNRISEAVQFDQNA